MTNDHVFGSDQLTPELLRSAQFDELDGRVDAAQVREYLERVASSLEVFMSGDAPTALRAEFSRNAEIAQQILDAGQNASEQLRRQAAEEAKRILDEAREATLGLRETVEAEIGQARTQVEAMRGTFIQDLRDLYDRIGASLYRFERAAEDSAVAPIDEPERAAPAPTPEPAPALVTETLSTAATDLETETDQDIKPPAWRQLPAEAWSGGEPAAEPAAEPEPAPAPAPAPEPELAPAPAPEPVLESPLAPATDPAAAFQVVEDEPLAPGEPLVDLNDLGGSWLEPAAEAPTPAPEPVPDIAHDDALAEALIGGVEAPAPIPPHVPTEAPADASAPLVTEQASPDAVAVRQQILDLLAAGQSRESVEAYLSNQLGLLNPGALVDAALGTPPGA